MPKERDPARDKARELWAASGKSLKLREIAERLRVPEATVRAWKSKDGWGKKSEQNAPKKIRNAPNDNWNAQKKKSGGQPGNKNGRGAPVGNLRAVTHGAYMEFYKRVLTDEEMEAYQYLITQKERDRLQSLYAQHQITERRLMEEIAAIKNGAETITHKIVSQMEPGGKSKESTKVVKISREEISQKETLRNFTDALTRIRAEMRRVADSLQKLNENEASSNNPENTASNFIESLMAISSDVWQNEKDGEEDSVEK